MRMQARAFAVVVPLIGLIALASLACGSSPPKYPVFDAGPIEDVPDHAPLGFTRQHFWVIKDEQGNPIAHYDADPNERFREMGCVVEWRDDFMFQDARGWFRGECSGSTFDKNGQLRFGPSPRGLDRFATTVENGRVLVDTSKLLCGPDSLEETLCER